MRPQKQASEGPALLVAGPHPPSRSSRWNRERFEELPAALPLLLLAPVVAPGTEGLAATIYSPRPCPPGGFSCRLQEGPGSALLKGVFSIPQPERGREDESHVAFRGQKLAQDRRDGRGRDPGQDPWGWAASAPGEGPWQPQPPRLKNFLVNLGTGQLGAKGRRGLHFPGPAWTDRFRAPPPG